mgnify:CR=1 FL=1
MKQRFRGEWTNKVDAKGRVSIPASFRRVLEICDPDWQDKSLPNLVLVYGRKGTGCIEGYSMRSIHEVDDMISALPRYSKNREILERLLNSNSVQIQLDENGRIVLSTKLREMIGIKNEALFAGMGEKFEVWNPISYQKNMEEMFESIKDPINEQNIFDILDEKMSHNQPIKDGR